jgi:hypothetical protein
MKLLRMYSAAAFLLSAFLVPAAAQTIPTTDAKNHIGAKETVCGLMAGRYISAQSQGSPTFIDLDKPYCPPQ